MARASAARALGLSAAGALLSALAPAVLAQYSAAQPPSFAGAHPGAGPAGASFLPGVRSTLTASDNLLLRPRGHETGGFRVEVSPYVNASINGPRAQGSLGYAARGLYGQAGGESSSAIRHDLRASGNALLIGDWFGVQGSAATYFVNTSPFGVLGPDPIISGVNISRISTATVSPYAQGRIPGFADYRAQYSLAHTNASDEVTNFLGRREQRVQFSLTSAPGFNPWAWSLTSGGSQREFGNGLDLHSASTVATLYYVFGPELRVGASANFLYLERLTNSDGDTRGWGPGFSVDWVPSTRTTLRLNLVEQYYGSNASLALAHRAARWSFGLQYTRAVLASNNAGVITLNPSDIFSAGGFPATLNPIYQQLLSEGLITNSESVVGAGLLNDALVRSRMVTASIGYRLPRGSLVLTGFRTLRETALDSAVFLPATSPLVTSSFGRYETQGASFGLSQRLDAQTGFTVSATLNDVRSLVFPERARLSTVSASLNRRLDRKVSASAGVQRTVQSARQGSVAAYDENTVFGAIDVRF